MKLRPSKNLPGAISPIGYGAMSLAGAYGSIGEKESFAVLGSCLDLGVTLWDTANAYGEGMSETLIGKFLAEDRGRRGRIALASKYSIRRNSDGVRFIDNSEAHMVESLEGTLKRLGVERIDLYYAHRYNPVIPIEETIGALARQVKAGKIGAIGLSEVSPDTLRRAAAVHPIGAVQSEYSLWVRGPELGMLQATAELGAAFVAFSPVARGYLTGRMQKTETFPAADFRATNPRFLGLNWRRNRDRLQPFLDLAARRNEAPASLALAWVLAKAPHVVAIPGTRWAKHLDECARGGDISLTAAEVAEIERVLPLGFAAGERYTPAMWESVEKY
jgi:aryl-alcohol dehydrogenase-like predicted oxidoreductase